MQHGLCRSGLWCCSAAEHVWCKSVGWPNGSATSDSESCVCSCALAVSLTLLGVSEKALMWQPMVSGLGREDLVTTRENQPMVNGPQSELDSQVCWDLIGGQTNCTRSWKLNGLMPTFGISSCVGVTDSKQPLRFDHFQRKPWYGSGWQVSSENRGQDLPIVSHEPSFSHRFRDFGKVQKLATKKAKENQDFICIDFSKSEWSLCNRVQTLALVWGLTSLIRLCKCVSSESVPAH